MRLNETSAVVLDDAEITALAKQLVARQAATDWLEWEDVPEPAERTFESLLDAVKAESKALLEASRDHDRATNIDSAYLLEQST